MKYINDIFSDISRWFTEHGERIGQFVLENLGQIGFAVLKSLLVLILGWWVSSLLVKAVSGMLKRTKVDHGIQTFVCSCARIGLRVIVFISAIAALGINITSIITALGAAGITLGLAMQDSLSNFASGVLILFNRPFKTGDYIEFEGSSGTVERIELMYTVLRSPDNKEIIYPNSKITADRVTNYTAQENRRLDLRFPIGYGCDVNDTRRILAKVCAECEYIDHCAETVIGIAELSSHAIVLEVRAWINGGDYWDAYFDMHERVLAAFRENGIAVPYEQLDVHVKQD